MTGLITWLVGEAGGWIAAAVAGLITLAGVYLRGRADGKAKVQADADRAWRKKTIDRQEIEDEIAQYPDLARRAHDSGLVRPDAPIPAPTVKPKPAPVGGIVAALVALGAAVAAWFGLK